MQNGEEKHGSSQIHRVATATAATQELPRVDNDRRAVSPRALGQLHSNTRMTQQAKSNDLNVLLLLVLGSKSASNTNCPKKDVLAIGLIWFFFLPGSRVFCVQNAPAFIISPTPTSQELHRIFVARGSTAPH